MAAGSDTNDSLQRGCRVGNEPLGSRHVPLRAVLPGCWRVSASFFFPPSSSDCLSFTLSFSSLWSLLRSCVLIHLVLLISLSGYLFAFVSSLSDSDRLSLFSSAFLFLPMRVVPYASFRPTFQLPLSVTCFCGQHFGVSISVASSLSTL